MLTQKQRKAYTLARRVYYRSGYTSQVDAILRDNDIAICSFCDGRPGAFDCPQCRGEGAIKYRQK